MMKINKRFVYIMFMNLLIVLSIISVVTIKSIEVSGNDKSEDVREYVVYESEFDDHDTTTSSANVSSNVFITTLESEKAIISFSRNLSENDKYLLAKIAMAEAEGESIETKVYVILTILNRVYSEYFPNTVEEVIFQNDNGIYQFSPVMSGGRWWSTEPNEECWEAVEMVNKMQEDVSFGALYFESCEGESWHSRNLEFLFESNCMRFYK